MKIRYESFGGIIRIDNPPATIYVDKKHMKRLNYKKSKFWKLKKDYLSAPIDTHFALTNNCPLGCKNCYKNSKKTKHKLSLEKIKKIIGKLAELKIFSIAFGGGEPFSRKDIFDIAKYAVKKEISPSITTNGYYINKNNAKKCKIFDHIHISLDIAHKDLDNEKGKGAFKYAVKAIDELKKQDIHVGINCLITQKNFNRLEELVRFCISKNIKDITFLRLKPIGKAKKDYRKLKLTYEQNKVLIKKIENLVKKYKIFAQIDCSLAPMLCSTKPNKKILDFFGTQGCVGGNTFIEIKEDSRLRACSFSRFYSGNALELKKQWDNLKEFNMFRNIIKNIKQPCKSCKYLDICRGGCHIISDYYGNFKDPDPECPLVIEYKKK